MTGYLIRRFFQMMVVVLLSTMAIYVILNVAPGGPLSGLKLNTGKGAVSNADIARLEAYLGIDKPLMLRYITWLVGEDWLGAEKVCLSPLGCDLAQVDSDGLPLTDLQGKPKKTTRRFWVPQGLSYISPGYKLWVVVPDTARSDGSFDASYVEYRGEKELRRPAKPTQGDFVELTEGGFVLKTRKDEVRVYTTESTRFVLPYWVSGLADMQTDYQMIVAGAAQDDGSIVANYVEYSPIRREFPKDLIEGDFYKSMGSSFILERGQGQQMTVNTNNKTTFVIPDRPEKPSGGAWLSVGWLFGNHGLLGEYAPYHGDARGVLRMDWGVSWKIAPQQSVAKLIKSRLGPTLLLMSLATVVSLVIAIPIGIYSAVKQYSKLDYAVTTFSFFGSAMPVFWFGLMMVLLFSIKFNDWGLPYFPANGMISPRTPPEGSLLALVNASPGGLVDRIGHLVLPGITLSLLYMAGWSRFMRASMLEVLRQDYVRTARAKGLRERVVIAKHALRNGLIPIITIVVFQLPGLFGGAIITETIFAYPGMGRLYFQALGQSDWPVVMIDLLITAILVVVATLIGDILYTIVDPRIRYD